MASSTRKKAILMGHMETSAERFDTATSTRGRFAPDKVLLKDDGRWPGIHVEQWRAQACELPETVLFQHGLLVNLSPKTSEIRWAGCRPISCAFPTGSVAILPAGLPYSANGKHSCTTLVLTIAPDHLQSAAQRTGCVKLELSPAYGVADTFIREAGRALASDIRAGYPCGAMYGEAIGVALVAHLIRHHAAAAAPSVETLWPFDAKRGHIEKFITDRLGTTLSLSQMADYLQLEVHSFSRWFKRAFGMAPHQYVLTRRIELAKTRLSMSREPLVTIALQCGFGSQSHFTTAFRRLVGAPPAAYRGR
jgi:AraC family transcriptional regulator